MIRVGKFVATHGIKGALILKHVLPNNDWLKSGQAIMVAMQKGSHIPYFVSETKAHKAGEMLVYLEDLITPESAKVLVSKEVFVESHLLDAMVDESPLAWIGFKLTDNKHGDLGELEDVYQSGTNWLGQIRVNNKEVLIPLISEFIKSINVNDRTMSTELPEGLIEIYL